MSRGASGTAVGGQDRFARWTAIVAGVFFVAAGIWAMVHPRSFFDAAATFEPYNRHLLQDIGAFQIGLGTVLLVAAGPGRGNGLATGLIGVGVGTVMHTVSHVVGTDLGGNPSTDIPTFAILAAVLLIAGLAALRRPSGGDT